MMTQHVAPFKYSTSPLLFQSFVQFHLIKLCPKGKLTQKMSVKR